MGNSRNTNTTLVVVTMLVLLSLYVTNCAAIHMDRARVYIKNQLAKGGPAQDLTFSCKSKDDDLGSHVLPPLGSWDFGFHPNFWPSTLYYCKFWWPSLGSEIKHFDIYDQKRDQRYCDDCCWSIFPNGACRCKCTGPCNYLHNCYGWTSVSRP